MMTVYLLVTIIMRSKKKNKKGAAFLMKVFLSSLSMLVQKI
uniref:Uncharacterized protein n=1 Tax=Rhizophora mucronata TaxID=61149 RepID=A0A2P2R2H3_RHIMU